MIFHQNSRHGSRVKPDNNGIHSSGEPVAENFKCSFPPVDKPTRSYDRGGPYGVILSPSSLSNLPRDGFRVTLERRRDGRLADAIEHTPRSIEMTVIIGPP